MRRRAAAGKARHCQVEAAPEEMHRAHLADKAGAECSENPVGLHQDPPEAVDVFGVIGAVLPILLERYGIGDLDRRRPNPDVEPERLQPLHDLAVEIGNGAGTQRETFGRPVIGRNRQAVTDEIEIDLEGPSAVGDRRGGQPAARHIERDLPPVIDQRRLRQPDLADHLGPHMKRAAGVAPFREW